MKTVRMYYVYKNSNLIGYSDSNYTEDISQKSTSGYLFILASGTIA